MPGGSSMQAITKPKIALITDGMSITIGVVECGPPVPWSKPADISIAGLNQRLPNLDWPFKNVRHVGMMDGGTQAFTPTLPEQQMRAMLTAASGEVLPSDLMKQFRVRLPATTAEDKVMLEKSRVELAETAKAVHAAMVEHLRLLQEGEPGDDLYDIEETTRELQRDVERLQARNKALAKPKK